MPELAARCGITRAALSHVENGTRLPSLDLMAKLAQALSVHPGELWGAPPSNNEAERVDTLTVRDSSSIAKRLPTVLPGDTLVFEYRYDVEAGDLVLFQTPDSPERRLGAVVSHPLDAGDLWIWPDEGGAANVPVGEAQILGVAVETRRRLK